VMATLHVVTGWSGRVREEKSQISAPDYRSLKALGQMLSLYG
jgi:hypothetical protein